MSDRHVIVSHDICITSQVLSQASLLWNRILLLFDAEALVPQWRDVLLNSILAVLCTEKDNLVHGSAVSNLAELCRLLHYSLDGILWEVSEKSWRTKSVAIN